jgi:hypothetical protein
MVMRMAEKRSQVLELRTLSQALIASQSAFAGRKTRRNVSESSARKLLSPTSKI